MAVLRANNILMRQGNGFVLDVSSLEFQPGRIYALIGPNGAGKTTLLNILSLVNGRVTGEIYFMGEKVTASNTLEIRRRIGMVMENPYLFHTTVFKNVAAGLRFRSADKELWNSSVREALGAVGLEGFEKRYAPELSRGESQRVAIARTLALRPDVLLLDEPFTNIDKRNSAVLEVLIRAVSEKYRTTIVFTTHDLAQAYRVADEVISIVEGRVVKGSLENLFSGEAVDADGLEYVRVSPKISVTAATEKRGKVRISIAPQDIILSLKPIESSALNSFEGIIRRIHMESHIVRVFIEVDRGVEFVAVITKASYDKMRLTTDSTVFTTFKGTSVTVF